MTTLAQSTAQSEHILHYLNPLTLARSLWQQRSLIWQFSQRDVVGRYKGSFLGIFWSLVNPLALLLIYTFVFGVVFQSRWPQARTTSLAEFALITFCGLMVHNVFAETLVRAPLLIVNVPNYVKKVVFPLEVLAVSSLGGALFHGGISLAILLGALLLTNGGIAWTLPLLPLVLLPLVFLSLGLSWFLASLGVFIRDIGHSITLAVQVLFFLTPIFYPLEAIPEPFQTLIRLNPMSAIVGNTRAVVLWGQLPDWTSLTVWTLIGGAVMVLGYTWFMKSRRAFADVI
ncbi:MAG: ABC transporter permease [Roseiflexaceae bacterium]